MLKYIDAPIVEIIDSEQENAGIKLFIKKEYQNHSTISGNKWWKLKYNLEETQNLEHKTVLTFGGAFSNHIYATAAAANELGFRSIGIIRGEEVLPLNETLAFAKSCGMELHYISREEYQKKTTPKFSEQLKQQFGNFYTIPEGGTNLLALKGCAEFAREKLSGLDFDYLCLPVGTGGTMAGIIAGLEGKKKIIGISVLKNGGFLVDEVNRLVKDFSGKEYSNWHIETEYHFGGYAKKNYQLDQIIARMKNQHDLLLDFVYTGKMMAGVFDLISKNHFPQHSKILVLHTGGIRN
jgi:1-aminocyclopropane-1-carboxylate deaminase